MLLSVKMLHTIYVRDELTATLLFLFFPFLVESLSV